MVKTKIDKPPQQMAKIKNVKMLKKVIGISNKTKNIIGFYSSTIKNSSTNI